MNPPINVSDWLTTHASKLLPPACNRCIVAGNDLEVMLVAGPNDRRDFHVNPTEELFYQIYGSLQLDLIEQGGQPAKKVKVEEGSVFLLAAGVPHRPQRAGGTVGLVIERRRPEGMKDALAWYCEHCWCLLDKREFYCANLDTDIRKCIEEHNEDCSTNLCGHCEQQQALVRSDT